MSTLPQQNLARQHDANSKTGVKSTLAIIIVSWNAGEYLRKCLHSVCATMPVEDFEIWVVDNNSSDGTPDMIEREFPEVNLIRNDRNLGFAAANNLAIRACRARYVCLVNSDVEVLEGCFETLLRYMQKQPDTGVTGPQLLNADGTVQPSCYGHPNRWNTLCHALGLAKLFPGNRWLNGLYGKYWPQTELQAVEAMSACFLVIREQVLEQVGLLDEDFYIYWEDFDFCTRVQDAGWQIVYVPQAKAVHYGGASSANAPVRFMIETERACLHYWRKHHAAPGVLHIGSVIFMRHFLRLIFRSVTFAIKPAARADARGKIKKSLAALRWLLTGAKTQPRDSF